MPFSLTCRLSGVLFLLWFAPAAVFAQASPPPGFVETESGCLPDGGLCLVPPAHQSEPVRASVPTGTRQTGVHASMIWGTGRAEVVAPDGRVLLAVSDSLLHGHEFFDPDRPLPYFDYRDGGFRDRNRRFEQLCRDAGYRGCVTNLTYRYATSDTRWERKTWVQDGSPRRVDTLDVSWWGVVPDASADYQPLLAHILNVARLRQAPVVLFPECGVYGYYGSLVLASDVTIKGQGGAVLTEETDDLGHTFYPVRLIGDDQADRPPKSAEELRRFGASAGGCRTTLRALEHTAVQYLIQDELGEEEAGYVAPDEIDPAYQIKKDLHTVQTVIYAGSGVMEVGLEDLVLDGNLAGQHDDYEVLDRRPNWPLKEVYRNSPSNAGFVTTNHGGVEVPFGQHLRLERVAILGYSEGTLGHPNATWTLRDVRIADAPLNHLVYCTTGAWENVTLAGLAWHVGSPACAKAEGIDETTRIENLVVEDSRENPYRQPDDGGIGIRGGSLMINGLYMDLRDGAIQRPFSGNVDLLWARDGVVIFDDEGSPGLYHGRSRGLLFDDVEVLLNGNVQYLVGRGRKNVLGFRNVRVQALPGTDASLGAVLSAGPSGDGPLVFAEDLTLDVPVRNGFANVHERSATPRVRLCADRAILEKAPNVPDAECADLWNRYSRFLPASGSSDR